MSEGSVRSKRGWSKKPAWLMTVEHPLYHKVEVEVDGKVVKVEELKLDENGEPILVRLTHAELAVYDALAAHADNVTGEAWPSRARLMELAQVSLATYRKAIRSLTATGAVEVLGGGSGRQTKRYRLINRDVPPEGAATTPERVQSMYPQGVQSVDPELDPVELDSVELDSEELNPSSTSGELILFSQYLPTVGTPGPPITDGFEEFWSMAVKKKSPATARKAYAKAVRKVGREVVHTAWARHNRVWAAWPKGDRLYIQHPATWLNAEEWDADDPLPRSGGETWADVTDRWETAAANGWGYTEDVAEPTYPEITITANVIGDDNEW